MRFGGNISEKTRVFTLETMKCDYEDIKTEWVAS